MTDAVAPLPPPPRTCLNCGTTLLGGHCHACGQAARNPLGRLRDALADAFESLFDVDGRILATLRDLLVPGRLPINYLAGKRARYIAPLRMFVTLSVLTFFVAHFAVNAQEVNINVTDMDNSAIAAATTDAEVQAARAAQLAILEDKLGGLPDGPGRAGQEAALEARRGSIEQVAEARLQALERARDAGQPPPPPIRDLDTFKIDGKPWDAKTNPARIDGLPAFANDWLNAGIARGTENWKRYVRDQGALKDAWLAAIPTALFFLVPVFALLLRLVYAFSPFSWLQHLVVALYSHAFLLLVALLGMLLAIATRGTAADGLGDAMGPWLTLVTMAYLLWTQKRVYRQGWPLTVLKFGVLGMVYSMLLGIGALLALGTVFLR